MIYQEKRQFLRIKSSNIIYISRHCNSPLNNEEPLSKTTNLSLGGVLFNYHQQCKPKEVIFIEIRLPEISQKAQCYISIIRSIPTSSGLYATAGKYVHFENNSKEIIKTYIDRFLHRA